MRAGPRPRPELPCSDTGCAGRTTDGRAREPTGGPDSSQVAVGVPLRCLGVSSAAHHTTRLPSAAGGNRTVTRSTGTDNRRTITRVRGDAPATHGGRGIRSVRMRVRTRKTGRVTPFGVAGTHRSGSLGAALRIHRRERREEWCPRSGSNRHSDEFKSSASASWATGARPQRAFEEVLERGLSGNGADRCWADRHRRFGRTDSAPGSHRSEAAEQSKPLPPVRGDRRSARPAITGPTSAPRWSPRGARSVRRPSGARRWRPRRPAPGARTSASRSSR